ncbi:MAG: WG repeat-containing protein, partial [Fibrobacterota bacterium]
MSLAEFFSEHKEMIDGKKRDCRGNAVRIDEKWGYFDVETKQVIIKPRFDEAFMFSDGRGRVIMKSINPDDGISELEQYGFIDEKGDFVVRPSYPYARDFSSGLAVVVNDNDLWGYINTNGEEVIPCQFEDADDFDGAYAAVCNKGVAGRIDKKGVFTPDSLANEENLALLPDKELMLKLIDLYEDALTNG